MADQHPRSSDETLTVGYAGEAEAVTVPWPILLRNRLTARAHGSERFRWWVLWTVLAGLFSVNVTFTIFAVALPRIARDFETSTNTLTWVITGPLLAFGIVAPVLGKVGDLKGHRRTYLLGLAGAGTLALGITSLLFALNRGPEWGWSSPPVLAGFVLGPLALAAFVAVERRAAEPLLPLAIIRRRNFSLPIGAQMFANFAYMGGFILSPILLGRMFGYGESKIGFFVLSRPLSFSIAAPVAGYLAVRVGERVSAVAGTLTVVGSMLAFATVTPDTADLFIILALALSGIGMGMASPSISSSVANSVDEEQLGIASAAQQLVTQVGVVAGIQLMSTIQASREATAGLVGSFRAAYLLGAGVCLAGVGCALFLRSAQRTPADEAVAATP